MPQCHKFVYRQQLVPEASTSATCRAARRRWYPLNDRHTHLGPRIALLTPYAGGNLGDAAIQDALISNLGERMSGFQVAGICLNCDNFRGRHGDAAFPLCATNLPFYTMVSGPSDAASDSVDSSKGRSAIALVKHVLAKTRIVRKGLRTALAWMRIPVREFQHCVEGFCFIRTQDIVIVSGGGQLDEEWGGSWGHPFALFKWAVLSRIARVPYVMASVGAQKVQSIVARFFFATALRLSLYRSYRDPHSRAIAGEMFRRAIEDPVVPDLAFSLKGPGKTIGANKRAASRRLTVAISPIAFSKPGHWPTKDPNIYNHYLKELSNLSTALLARGYGLTLVCSSIGDDTTAIADLLQTLNCGIAGSVSDRIRVPKIARWQDFIDALQNIDLLIASRLHSLILGFIAEKPAIAISFDPKVDWLMETLGQTEYLLQIGDFRASEALDALDRAGRFYDDLVGQLATFRKHSLAASAKQFDLLAELAIRRYHRATLLNAPV